MSALTREEIESALEDAAPYGDLADVPVNAKWLRTVLKTALQSLEQEGWQPIRPEVYKFALLMEARLKRNDHRGGWKSCERQYLFERLEANMKDLYEAWLMPQEDMNEILGALADIGNFAMMLADTSGPLPPSPHTGLEKT